MDNPGPRDQASGQQDVHGRRRHTITDDRDQSLAIDRLFAQTQQRGRGGITTHGRVPAAAAAALPHDRSSGGDLGHGSAGRRGGCKSQVGVDLLLPLAEAHEAVEFLLDLHPLAHGDGGVVQLVDEDGPVVDGDLPAVGLGLGRGRLGVEAAHFAGLCGEKGD
ncbi:hypothetical protein PG996_004872 [Apiospora saccharicola]|uniref:Uncharacterized protein n=1 Tax=Apiospora saccharicola TaxID=335842 RepID=A0ABR1VNN9_9PEZI